MKNEAKKPKKEPKRLAKRRVHRLGPESGSEHSASEEDDDDDSQAPDQGVPGTLSLPGGGTGSSPKESLHLAAILNCEGNCELVCLRTICVHCTLYNLNDDRSNPNTNLARVSTHG